MIVFEFKLKGSKEQFLKIEEAIRTCQFIRNKVLRYWRDNKDSKPKRFDLSKQCKPLSEEFEFCRKLNSMARQASADRAWLSIERFFKKLGKFPKFKKNNRSVTYKTSGWKLSEDRKHITFTDGLEIGRLKLIGSKDLLFYSKESIKRVTLVKRADGYYAQFTINYERKETQEKTGKIIGIDLGLESFLTDSEGNKVDNPRFLRKSETKLKKLQRLVSKRKKGSIRRKKAIQALGKKHLQVSRQRKDFAVKTARELCLSNDKVVLENLQSRNMVRNRCLAKSICDASWRLFRNWLDYFGKVFDREIITIDPKYTSQECSSCGATVKKSLSIRTHVCPHCGYIADRDHNAAINILRRGTAEFTLREKKSSGVLALC